MGLSGKDEEESSKNKGEKRPIMIKIADVRSHFSKGVSLTEFGTNPLAVAEF